MSLIGRVSHGSSAPPPSPPLQSAASGAADGVSLSSQDPISQRMAELEAEIQRSRPSSASTPPSPDLRAAMNTSTRTQAAIGRSMDDQMALVQRTQDRISAMMRKSGFEATA